MYKNLKRMTISVYIWCAAGFVSILPAVVFWGISFDTKTYETVDDPAPMRIVFFILALLFTTPLVVFFINIGKLFVVNRLSELFSADADGFVPVSELASAMGMTEDKVIAKATSAIRKGHLINCNYSAHQRAFLLSDKIGTPTGMFQGAPANHPFIGVHCPGCGASLKIRESTQGTCPYCGRLIIAAQYSAKTR